jgi:G:T-mismatch repair DNA endonuclease (very short patch repair protein)
MRDRRTMRKLRRAGWKVLVVWECHARDPQRLRESLTKFLGT